MHSKVQHVREEAERVMKMVVDEQSRPGFNIPVSYQEAELMLDLVSAARREQIPPKRAARSPEADRLSVIEYKLRAGLKRRPMDEEVAE